MNSSQEDNLVLLQKILHSLEEAKVTKIDPAQISLESKTAFKIATFRETMLWRYCETLRGVVGAMKEELNLPAVILCRSGLEVAAISYYFGKMLAASVEKSNISEADELVTKMILGSKEKGWDYQAVNILTALDHTDREFSGMRKLYDSLSEYSHPNWHGSGNLFARNDAQKLITRFGISKEKDKQVNGLLISASMISIHVASSSIDKIADLIPKFANLHEEKINSSRET